MLFEAINELGREDPNNPQVLVQDYGRITLEQAKDQAMARLEEATKVLRESDDPDTWRKVYGIVGTGIFGNMLRAIIEAHQNMEGK